MFSVCLIYSGFILIFAGCVSLLKPLTFLKIRSRRRGALVGAAGVVLVACGMVLPAREIQVTEVQTELDHFVPIYQFHEFHSIRVAASKAQAYRAIKDVTANEIFLFRSLTWIRRLGKRGPESILNAPEHQPLLDVAISSGFLMLAEEPEHEIVIGTLVGAPRGWRPNAQPTPEDFSALHAPGFAVAAMNFRLEDGGAGETIVTTETRVYATDVTSRRKFARYWRVIYPGSGLIRRMWLRAVKRRAEAAIR